MLWQFLYISVSNQWIVGVMGYSHSAQKKFLWTSKDHVHKNFQENMTDES